MVTETVDGGRVSVWVSISVDIDVVVIAGEKRLSVNQSGSGLRVLTWQCQSRNVYLR